MVFTLNLLNYLKIELIFLGKLKWVFCELQIESTKKKKKRHRAQGTSSICKKVWGHIGRSHFLLPTFQFRFFLFWQRGVLLPTTYKLAFTLYIAIHHRKLCWNFFGIFCTHLRYIAKINIFEPNSTCKFQNWIQHLQLITAKMNWNKTSVY